MGLLSSMKQIKVVIKNIHASITGVQFKYKFNSLLLLSLVLLGCNKKQEVTLYYDPATKKKPLFSYHEKEPGCKEGVFKEFDENGKLIRECEYKNCRLWRLIANYKPDGTTLDKDAIKDGNGEDVRYRQDGTLLYKISYKNGLPDGKAQYFDATGRTLTSLVYLVGELVGQEGELTFPAQTPGNATDSTKNTETPNAPPSGNLAADLADADNMIKLIQSGDANGLYARAFSEFKKAQSLKGVQKYIDYTRKLYGPMKSFNRQSYNFASQAGLGDGMQVIYLCTFGYCKGGIELKLLKENNQFKLAGYNIQVEDYTPISQVENIAKPTIDLLKRGMYDDIYNTTSDRFKKITPKDQFDLLMKELGSVGKVDGATLYQHQVGVLSDKLALIAVYELRIGGKEVFMEMTFTEHGNGFILEGMNLQGK